MLRLNNIDIAVLQKTNELAERYGFKPTDLVISFGPKSENDLTNVLRYESPPPEDKWKQYDAMIAALGIKVPVGHEPTLEGDDERIYDALVAAIKKAPKARSR